MYVLIFVLYYNCPLSCFNPTPLRITLNLVWPPRLVRSLLEDEPRREEEVLEGEPRPLEAAGRPRLHRVYQVPHESRVHLFRVDRTCY